MTRTVGFFTDTTLCIGCKACEVACKQWNQLPGDGFHLTGMSYDNTAALGATTWRHVTFAERPCDAGQGVESRAGGPGVAGPGIAWKMMSDVCKHCARAGCLEACPTGAIVRTEHGSVYVQPDVCNGCGYCVPACPFGVIERQDDDGRAYKYAGGLAGAAATLAAAAELGRRHLLSRRLHAIAVIGEAAGAACLIADLGRPARFHHMMRVFRPTSPMNLGTWILSAASASSGLAQLGSLRGRHRLGAASCASAITGAMLSTYTAVLIGNTAIPVWRAARRALPVWFAAASTASLASLVELIGPARQLPRGYAVTAKAAELVGAVCVARAARRAGVDPPLRQGGSGRRWRGAMALGVARLAATLLGAPRLAGALGTAAALAARFAIVDAGRASAADPRATFAPQRASSPRARRARPRVA